MLTSKIKENNIPLEENEHVDQNELAKRKMETTVQEVKVTQTDKSLDDISKRFS